MADRARTVKNVLTDKSRTYDVHIDHDDERTTTVINMCNEKVADDLTDYINRMEFTNCIVGVESA